MQSNPPSPATPPMPADSFLPPIPKEQSQTNKKSKLPIFITILLFICLGCFEYSQPEVKLKLKGIGPERYNENLSGAACNGNAEIVRLLLEAGTDVNMASPWGSTPLYLAAQNGHTECVRLLLATPGIDVNKANNYGTTPLDTAANNGHTECARLIREAGGRRR